MKDIKRNIFTDERNTDDLFVARGLALAMAVCGVCWVLIVLLFSLS